METHLARARRHPSPGRAARSDSAQEGRGDRRHPPADPGAHPQRPARATRSRADSRRLRRRATPFGPGAIRVEQLGQTERGLRLTLHQTKGSQTDAVIVPLPYGHTELCPVRALTAWLEAASIESGPVFRRIWLPKKARPGGSRRGSASQAGGTRPERSPLPCPGSAVSRSRLEPSPRSSNRPPPRRGSKRGILAGTA